MAYKPPYTVSTEMLEKVSEITLLIGQIQGYQLLTGNLKLRRQNKIKTILSSLAIEGNTLNEDQVSAILDGKPVLGPPKEILEVQNALAVYDTISDLDPYNEDDLLSSHRLLMGGLIPDAGRYRSGSVGVFDGAKVIHLGPPAKMVPRLMGSLFDYTADYREETIIKSCVFHYEFEFIHPFSDGNGRMGRLWQTVLLMSKYPVLQFVPFETIIHQRQQGYYQALADSQTIGNSDPFILFMLDALLTALTFETDRIGVRQDFEGRMLAFREALTKNTFTRKDYQLYHKTLSSAASSRDLRRGVDENLLAREGKQRTTTYRFR
ncbi:Fic family protein [Lewinella sp. 4G2]|uniref:Fic family protein n=1 Tax=Lewinella sp. 4G2 TaxID=1803372 RepID=UPI0007B47E17|nr:Fic family protein [Lewinella sp. 4G2]OAV46295.1 hypothetical protein A3850_018750 [Lewinella sp. 4G2]